MTSPVDLPSGPVVVVVAAALLGCLAAVRRMFPDTGTALLGMAMIALPWNAVRTNGVALGDALLLLATAFIGLDILRSRATLWLPAGFWIGGLFIALSGVWVFLVPTSPDYMMGRLDPTSAVQKYGTLTSAMPKTNLTNLLQFELSLLLVPLLIVAAAKTAQTLYRLLDCFIFSAVISSVFAVMDATGVANISGSLLGFAGMSYRASGLGSHPNQLATNIALAIPLVLLWFLGSKRRRMAAITVIGILGLGMVVTGSRGGILGAGFGIMLVIWTVPSVRRRIRLLASVLGLVGAGVVLASPGLLEFLHGSLRFAPGEATQSNLARIQALHQATADFLHAPLHGIGFAVVHDAQEVHLGLLAAGGLLAFVGFVVYAATALDLGRTATPFVPLHLIRVLLASVAVLLALGFVGNAVIDLYLYIPVGFLAGVAQIYRRQLFQPQRLVDQGDISKVPATDGMQKG